MKLRRGLFLMLVVSSMIAPTSVFACSCAEIELDHLNLVDVAFVGRADYSGGWWKKWRAKELDTTFEVLEPLKNISESTVVVQSKTNSASCGKRFNVGKSYIVLAYKHDGVLRSGYCSAFLLSSEKGKQLLGLFSEAK